MNTPSMAKSLTSMWTSNGLVKSKNLNTGVDDKIFFKSSNAFYYSSFHSKDNSFLRRFESGFVNCEKPFIKF
jgi:hypothetical protein